MPANHNDLERRLWDAADELRANSRLKSSEYSIPVLGLIFLRYADHKFAEAEKKMPQQASGRRKIGKTDYQAQGVLFLPEKARFGYLLNLPEGTDIGKAINEAMKAIEVENEDLKDVLPKTYNTLDKSLLVSLLKNFSSIPMTIEGDAFGKIYEYFLGKFAMAEGQKGGEFFTPTSIVKLIVEIIEPFHGKILDPACGSGGMFVQSAAFVEHHKKNVNEISIYGQEKIAETIRLNKMNLALVIFDLLTKPEIKMTKAEEREVKKVAKELLEKLKSEKLVLDWKKRQSTRAAVRYTIETVLDELPRIYTPEIYQQKCETVYQHVFDCYQGQGKSLYMN